MPSEIVLAVIGVVGTAIAAYLGRSYTRRQHQLEAEAARLLAEREREAARQATEEGRWRRLEEDVARLATEVQALRQENEALRRENALARAAALDAADQARDQEELIEDLLTWLIAHDSWTAAGATPPPPTLSWRVQAALRRRRATMTGPTPAATDTPTTPTED